MRRYVSVLIALLSTAAAGCGNSAVPVRTAALVVGASSADPDQKPSMAVSAAVGDVRRAAPALAAWFSAHGYPTSLQQAAAAVPRTGIVLDPSDALAGYRLEPGGRQFLLCVQNLTDAWASYDTATGHLVHRISGGCPQH